MEPQVVRGHFGVELLQPFVLTALFSASEAWTLTDRSMCQHAYLHAA